MESSDELQIFLEPDEENALYLEVDNEKEQQSPPKKKAKARESVQKVALAKADGSSEEIFKQNFCRYVWILISNSPFFSKV